MDVVVCKLRVGGSTVAILARPDSTQFFLRNGQRRVGHVCDYDSGACRFTSCGKNPVLLAQLGILLEG